MEKCPRCDSTKFWHLSTGQKRCSQYSFLVAVVIASAVVPTLIADMAFLPRHLLPKVSQAAVSSMPEEKTAGMDEEDAFGPSDE